MSHPREGGARLSRLSTAHKNKGLDMHTLLEDPPDTTSDEQPESNGSFHRQIVASLMQHHQYVDKARRSLQPPSPASYSSSMELTPYNPAATPTSSLDYRGRTDDLSFSLKTSTELLKVLNRIWCLEEQHASNRALVKGLKMELNNARMRVKELLRQKQMDRQVIDDLLNQAVEQERVTSALQSVREELEEERKLRKRSESLHRKLAREISEVKSSFSKVLNGLEREQRAHVLLEDLCDEFALGIREYEQEVRSLKHRTNNEQVPRDHLDSLVLHISEAWLDERMQMKLAEEMGEKGMIVDNLRPEIETFLKARRQTSDSTGNIDVPMKISSGLIKQSLEPYPLNEATSAPQDADDEDDDASTDSDTNCFELNKNLGVEFSNRIHIEEVVDSEEKSFEDYRGKRDAVSKEGETEKVSNVGSLSSLQARFGKHVARTRKPLEPEMNHIFSNLLRTNSSSIEEEGIHPEGELANVLSAGLGSPVKKGEPKSISIGSGNPESSSRWCRDPKENTLKAKLLEARLEGRSSRSRCS